jgi:hypothetical protein
MTVRDYLSQLDAKLEELANTIISLFIQRDIDANLEMGFIKGRITFLDGSMLEFSEQLPTERQKYRFHYMDAASNLILRWDSAPHHRHLSTFPFHLHTPQSVQEHGAITLLEVFSQIEAMLEL